MTHLLVKRSWTGNILCILLLQVLLLIVAGTALAFPKTQGEGECSACHKLTEKEAESLLKKLGGTVKAVRQAPVPGLFELLVEKDGKQGTIYIDYAKKRLMQGMVVDLETLRTLTAFEDQSHRMTQASSVDPKSLPLQSALVIGNPKGNTHLYVFLDPECPYCAKMYQELVKLEKMEPDLAIHLIIYPLPAHPGAYDKARSIVDSKNRNLLEKALAGQEIYIPGRPAGVKEVDEVIIYARRHDIVATPTTVLPNGAVLTGYRDAAELKNLIEKAP